MLSWGIAHALKYSSVLARRRSVSRAETSSRRYWAPMRLRGCRVDDDTRMRKDSKPACIGKTAESQILFLSWLTRGYKNSGVRFTHIHMINYFTKVQLPIENNQIKSEKPRDPRVKSNLT